MKKLFLFALAALAVSCQSGMELKNAPEKPVVNGLFSVVQLVGDSTSVVLTDYFPNPEVVDSVQTPQFISATLSTDKTHLLLIGHTVSLPSLSTINVWANGGCYSMVVRKGRKLPYTFTYNPMGKKHKEVYLVGQMNSWNSEANPLAFVDGVYKTDLMLNPGNYQYQLKIDGKQGIDATNNVAVDNGQGGLNSVIVVGNNEPQKAPHLTFVGFESGRMVVNIGNSVQGVIALWQNCALNDNFVTVDGQNVFVAMPSNAVGLKRSYIRLYAYNEFGESNDLLIPLDGVKPVAATSELTRADKNSQIMYFLMVDRFNNGNTANDKEVDDPEINPKANYFGGDLAGVTQKIKDGYFQSLGINTIWLSPITQNPLGAWGLYPNPRTKFSGYHGYWPTRSTKVDFRFGTEAELHELVNLAHQNSMNVILDYVANHVHQEHPIYQQHPDWATSLYLPDGSLNTERWDDHRLTTWFDVFLPTLDLERKEVYEPLTDSALFWLTNFNLDGFRHDATKHIHENFWRRLTQKIKLAVPDRSVYQIGETYGSKELIASYIGSGMLDSQFDFNIYDASVAAFARPSASFADIDANLHETFNYYGWNHLMANISGNQDRARFISYAGGDLKFDEDAKYAGWTRSIGVGDSVAYSKLCMLNAFNMTIPGVPTIYYGDEYGVPGANDPDNRRMMQFDNLSTNEQRTLETVKKIVAIRRQNMALNYGDFRTIMADTNIYAYLRTYLRNSVLTIFNKSNMPMSISFTLPKYMDNCQLEAQFGATFTIVGATLQIDLAPNSFEMLIAK